MYYCGNDGKRYVFPNDKVYFTWYPNFSGVVTISDQTLGSITIGGNVTYKPGSRLIKVNTDQKVYAVGAGGTLRWVETEAIAAALYGSQWKFQVVDIADSFFVNYKTGTSINSTQ